MFKVTGDLHREIDLYKLSSTSFPEGTLMTRDDILFQLGDFGLIWDCSPKEMRLRKWLNEKPWTTWFLDGNHENFDELEKFPIIEMNGGKVRKITDNIIWMQRGEVYEFYGYKFLVFGGAVSIDKHLRLPGRSWWPQETGKHSDFENACNNLDKHNWEVDYVLSHTCPYYEVDSFSKPITNNGLSKKFDDPTTTYLQEIKNKLRFKHWVFGHFHVDKSIGRFTCVYRKIITIGDDVK